MMKMHSQIEDNYAIFVWGGQQMFERRHILRYLFGLMFAFGIILAMADSPSWPLFLLSKAIAGGCLLIAAIGFYLEKGG